jgi:cellulose synthase/poly-beta-1,6-N-acetylglucosamine synthase-like glycosyltransferase
VTEHSKKRFYEIVPAALVWTTFAAALALAAFAPLWAIYFIIVYDVYWLTRVVYFVLYLLVAWRRHRKAMRTDWLALAKAQPRFEKIRHLIVLPTVKEGMEILRTTFNGLCNAAYPTDTFIVVLAGEEKYKDEFLAKADLIRQEFGHRFAEFLVTVHPAGLPGEIPGKGSNIAWAGRRAQELVDRLGIPYEDVVVSTFDIDTAAHPQYFACLAWNYLTNPRPLRTSYQPMVLYNNNIWDAPALVRIAAFGTTFWLMSELARPQRLSTFSSHSMSFRALVDVGFWERDIVTEDSRIFLQCLLHYNGEYSVTPMYIPVSMDAVQSATYAQSLRALYKQQRRWAWGIEHFPYLMQRFEKLPRFPLRKKLYYIWNLLEGMFTWATAPVLIFILGRLPLWFVPDYLRDIAIYQNAPRTLEFLMQLAMLGVLACGTVSLLLLPARPAHHRGHAWLVMVLQWLLSPLTFTLFGALPAIDAQTHLMLGRYLGYNVTEKKRT